VPKVIYQRTNTKSSSGSDSKFMLFILLLQINDLKICCKVLICFLGFVFLIKDSLNFALVIVKKIKSSEN
jgi:hypothetical protein